MQPKNLSEYIGNTKAVGIVTRYVQSYPELGKLILIVGPGGCGKTALVYAIAGELGMGVLEFSASDERDTATVDSWAGAARFNYDKRIILFDDVDGFRSYQGILKMAEVSVQPIILTATDEDRVNKKLLEAAQKVVVPRPTPNDIGTYVKKLAERLQIPVPSAAFERIFWASGGSYRAADLIVRRAAFTGSFRGIGTAPLKKLSDEDKLKAIASQEWESEENLGLDPFTAMKYFESNIYNPEELMTLNKMIKISRSFAGVYRMSKKYVSLMDLKVRGSLKGPRFRARPKVNVVKKESKLKKKKVKSNNLDEFI